MKTLTTLLLSIALLFGAASVSADKLSEEQSEMLQKYMSEPESRAAIAAIYWDRMRRETAELQTTLPIELNKHVVAIKVQYDGLKGITYFYVIDRDIRFERIKEQMVAAYCQDPSMAMYLTIFGGSLTYTYFWFEKFKEPHASFTISGTDCGAGV